MVTSSVVIYQAMKTSATEKMNIVQRLTITIFKSHFGHCSESGEQENKREESWK
jgi:hypothetical protein